MVVYFLLFILLSLPVFFEVKQKKLLLILFCIMLIILAAFSSWYSKDLGNYTGMYNIAISGNVSQEISFYLLANFVNDIFHNMFFIFPIYAALGVIIKVTAIRRLTEFIFPSLLIYFTYYFLLHEVTQIRAGVAAAFALLSFSTISERNKTHFFIFATLAFFFHYSALVIFPLYFIRSGRIQPVYYYILPAGFAIWILNINLSSLLELINIEYIHSKYQAYLSLSEIHKINILNVLALCRYIFCYFLLYKWEFLSKKSKHAVILIKVYILSVFSFIVLSDIPAIAFRVSEMLGIVEIILLPFLLYLIKQRELGKIIITIIGLCFLCLLLFYEHLLIF